MAIIKKKIGNATYLYEKKSYRDKETGKVKTKWTCLGKLDENGDLIPSKKKSAQGDEGRTGGAGTQDNHDKVHYQGKARKKKIIIPEIVEITTHKAEDLKLEATKIGGLIFVQDESKEFYDFTPDEKKGGYPVLTGMTKDKAKNPVCAYVKLNFDEKELAKLGISIPGIGRLEPFDREILTIVTSLYEVNKNNRPDGKVFLTTDMIARCLSGNKRPRDDNEIRKAIFISLRRLRVTSVFINATEEYDTKYNLGRIFEGVLLPSKAIQEEIVLINGQKVTRDCICVFDTSPLYQYGEGKRQISYQPVPMLGVPGLNNTKMNAEIKGYILRRITDMKKDMEKPLKFRRVKHSIVYSTILHNLSLRRPDDPEERKSLMDDIRERSRKILEFFKEQGLIKDFTEEKDASTGKTIARIKIQL